MKVCVFNKSNIHIDLLRYGTLTNADKRGLDHVNQSSFSFMVVSGSVELSGSAELSGPVEFKPTLTIDHLQRSDRVVAGKTPAAPPRQNGDE